MILRPLSKFPEFEPWAGRGGGGWARLKSILTRYPCCHCLPIAVLQSSKSTNLNVLTSILV